MRPELVYLCQPLATVVMGSYEPFKDMSWGVLAGSDTELSEMSPQTDPVSHESLHDCIQILWFFWFFFQISILRNFLTSLYRFWALLMW